MKYTIEGEGESWTASNGTDRVTAEDPVTAMMDLTDAEECRDVGGDFRTAVTEQQTLRTMTDARRRIENIVVRIIRLMAMDAPGVILRSESDLLVRYVGEYAALIEKDN